MINFDKALGNHEHALRLQARRQAVLAANLANADTPHYKARDIDFKQALSQSLGSDLTLATSDRRHVATATGANAGGELKYRIPHQAALDGNTVDADLEQAAFAENAMRYQATLRFLGSRFRGMVSAFKGGQ